MNELSPGKSQKGGGATLVFVGLGLMAFPALCLAFLAVSTGQSVAGEGQEVFFWAIYLGALSGILLVPVGLITLIVGIVKLLSR